MRVVRLAMNSAPVSSLRTTRTSIGAAVQQLLLRGVDRLPAPTRTLLLVAAAEAGGDLGLVLRAADRLGVDTAALEPAEVAGLVQVDGVHFRSVLSSRARRGRSAIVGAVG